MHAGEGVILQNMSSCVDCGVPVLIAWMNENLAFFTLIMLSFEPAVLKLAFRRVSALNFPEWLA